MELLPFFFMLMIASFLIIKFFLKKVGSFWIFIMFICLYSLVLKYGIETDSENDLYN